MPGFVPGLAMAFSSNDSGEASLGDSATSTIAAVDRHYLCKICGAKRSKRSIMVSHMQKEHPDNLIAFTAAGQDRRRYLCRFCGTYLSKLSVLRNHMKRHECSSSFPNDHNKKQCLVSSSTERSTVSCSTSSTTEGNLDACSMPLYSEVSVPSVSRPLSHESASISSVEEEDPAPESKRRKVFECSHCGFVAKKAAHLQQHLLRHSDERVYKCPRDGCEKSYKRQDHLNRHLLSHESSGILCPRPGCIAICSSQANLVRHMKRHELKGDSLQRATLLNEKSFECPEPGCGKSFRYPSMVEQHHASSHGLQYSHILCGEPGCGKTFKRVPLLHDHIRECHPTIECSICGSTILRRNFNRHLMIHDDNRVMPRLLCPLDGCGCSYSNCSNLTVHIRVHHEGQKEYHCSFEDCCKRFSYRHTRDNHERTRLHCHTEGDFIQSDMQFQNRPRGGRKPVMLERVEDLFQKRIFASSNENKTGFCSSHD